MWPSRGNLDTLFAAVNAVRLGSRSLQKKAASRATDVPEYGGLLPAFDSLGHRCACLQRRVLSLVAGALVGLRGARREYESRPEYSNAC